MRRLLLLATATVTLAALTFGALWAFLPDPAPLAARYPRTTAVIEQRRAEARAAGRAFRPRQAWVGLEAISPRLVQAVLVSEDASFYQHGPFDWREARVAAEDSLGSGRRLRGASTLTQQLAKNLWLGTERTGWRKVKEAVLAVKLERRLAKRRILALYLGVAEWGDGIFGAEAAARHHFGVAASQLTTAQAALLASMLPAPRRSDPRHPSPWLARRARRTLDRMAEAGRIDAAEHARARAELEWQRGGGGPRPVAGDGPDEPTDE